jgi:hypothetical protein
MSTTHTVLSGRTDERILSAYYDLAASPNTFDIFVFLVLAEIERRASQCDAMHLYIVPGPQHGFRHDTDVTNLSRQQYIQRNVLLSSHALMPSCAGVTLCSTRESVERELHAAAVGEQENRLVFPPGYSVHLPYPHYHFYRVVERWQQGFAVPPLQPSRHALTVVDAFLRQWCGSRKTLTVTLRETGVQPERNSNVEEWGRFVATLDHDEYAVLVLRDFEKIHEALPPAFSKCLPYPEAVIFVELRAALYQLAYLNLCINNGPAALLLLNPLTRYLAFKMVTDAVPCATPAHHRQWNWLLPGDQLQYATPFQRLVWKDDTADVLRTEFASIVRLIESGTYPTIADVSGYLQRSRQLWNERYPQGWTDRRP